MSDRVGCGGGADELVADVLVAGADELVARTDELVARPARRDALRGHVAGALEARPGRELLYGLTGLMGADLSAREWVEVTVAWQRMASFVHSGQLAAVAALDRALAPDPSAVTRRRGAVPTTRTAADELAPALGIAPVTASKLVGLARRADGADEEPPGLPDPDGSPSRRSPAVGLPAAADALAEGRLSRSAFEVVAAVTRGVPLQAARRVEALAVRIGARCTRSQLISRLEAEALAADPGSAARQAARGREERDVRLGASPVPGCRRLTADLPMLDAIATWQGLNGAATAAKDRGTRPDGTVEDRSLGQLRADALTGVVTGTQVVGDDLSPAGKGLVPTPERLRELAEVQLVVALETLVGISDLPATVPGHGAVDAATTREVAAVTRWRRLLVGDRTGQLVDHGDRTHPPRVAAGGDRSTGGSPPAGADPLRTADDTTDLADDPRWPALLGEPPSGAVLDHGLSRYVPPAPLRRHVHTRDATCIGPACEHTARGTQLDHTVDFGRTGPDGTPGTTSDDNLGSACRRMHNAKTHGGWRLEQPAPGGFVWTSPTGRTYARRARPLVPGWLRLRRWRDSALRGLEEPP